MKCLQSALCKQRRLLELGQLMSYMSRYFDYLVGFIDRFHESSFFFVILWHELIKFEKRRRWCAIYTWHFHDRFMSTGACSDNWSMPLRCLLRANNWIGHVCFQGFFWGGRRWNHLLQMVWMRAKCKGLYFLDGVSWGSIPAGTIQGWLSVLDTSHLPQDCLAVDSDWLRQYLLTFDIDFRFAIQLTVDSDL